ncbi:transmembrane protein 59-like [Ornithodoros turicata]
MLRHCLGILVVLVFSLALSSCEVLRKIEEESENCEAFCSQTYPLHTYPKAEHLESCKRGCKLFVIVGQNPELSDLNITHAKCNNACAELYPESPQYYACCLGCKEQLSQAETKAKTEQPVLIHSLTPLLFVQQVYERVVSHMCHFLQRTFTAVYLQRDTGKLVVVRGELEPIKLPDIDDDQSVEATPPCRSSSGRCDSDTSDGRSETLQQEASFPGSSWLDCISRQSGLPRWLLVLVLFLVVVTMVWLCCATMVTSPTASTAQPQQPPCYRSQKMGLNSDVDYLLLYDPSEQVKIQPPKDHEAPPLPVKIPLDQI